MTIAQPLAGRTAIVTGSGQNIGRAIALAFARAGAAVVVNGHRKREAVDAVVAEIRAFGGRASGIMADVGKPEDVERLVREAETSLGPVDILVSNVALRLHQPLLSISIDDWNRILNNNLSASFYLARAVLPGMKARGHGRIIMISGIDGFSGRYPNRAHNVVCKAGIHALAKTIAEEFGPHGVTANTVAPGAIETTRDWSQYGGDPEKWRQSRIQAIPLRRIGDVEHIAATCLYLAGESGAFTSGQVIHVNGGQYMG